VKVPVRPNLFLGKVILTAQNVFEGKGKEETCKIRDNDTKFIGGSSVALICESETEENLEIWQAGGLRQRWHPEVRSKKYNFLRSEDTEV